MARDTYKLQVEMTTEQFDALNELQNLGGLRTKKELLDNALTLLKWAVRQKKEGNVIMSVNAGNGRVRELELPYLETVRERSANSTPTSSAFPRELETVGSGRG